MFRSLPADFRQGMPGGNAMMSVSRSQTEHAGRDREDQRIILEHDRNLMSQRQVSVWCFLIDLTLDSVLFDWSMSRLDQQVLVHVLYYVIKCVWSVEIEWIIFEYYIFRYQLCAFIFCSKLNQTDGAQSLSLRCPTLSLLCHPIWWKQKMTADSLVRNWPRCLKDSTRSFSTRTRVHCSHLHLRRTRI